jgi:Ca2+-binding EF-hand superfamily protein
MKSFLGTLVVCVSLVATAMAQPPAGGEYGQVPGGQNGPGGPPPNAMFSAIDTDGDGAISMRELRKAVVALKQLDTDRDGKITQAEAMRGPIGPGGDPAAMIDGMMQNDKNGDGKLSKNELPRHMAQMLSSADANGDGSLDRAELTTAMQSARTQFGGGARGGFGSAPGGFGGANGGDPRPGGPNMMQYDRNGDGQLSTDEVPTHLRGLLRGADQNGNGTLDTQEMQAVQQRMNERARGQSPLPPGVRVGPQGVERTPQQP